MKNETAGYTCHNQARNPYNMLCMACCLSLIAQQVCEA